MDLVILLKALVLGIVEGLTEFLPISSTGHLIIAEQLLSFSGEKAKVFALFIQLGAILAVCWEYRQRIRDAIGGLGSSTKQRRFVLNVAVAFVPAAILGLLLGKHIKAHLFHPIPVAIARIGPLRPRSRRGSRVLPHSDCRGRQPIVRRRRSTASRARAPATRDRLRRRSRRR